MPQGFVPQPWAKDESVLQTAEIKEPLKLVAFETAPVKGQTPWPDPLAASWAIDWRRLLSTRVD